MSEPVLSVGVPRETFPGERRVALVPAAVPVLRKSGLTVRVESGAGESAGFPDAAYVEKGAEIVADRDGLFAACDVVVQVRACGANPEAGASDAARLRSGQVLIAQCEPLAAPGPLSEAAARGAVVFALELVPRITRAQGMDVLSSMATVAGYKAVILAAEALPRMFPLLMTAAGTVKPARVFVVGAGVAGLQAIATAKRLGAVVSAYDVRTAAREQVESCGGKFVDFGLETKGAEQAGGYAQALGEDFYRRQREAMAKVVAEHDVVITTAAVPGKQAPVLIATEMLRGMPPGSVVVDLAAERGGNCEATRPGETVRVGGVSVLGPVNLPATVPYHASEMYSRNVVAFLGLVAKKGQLTLDSGDEILRDTLAARNGEVVQPRIREALGLPPLPAPTPPSASSVASTSPAETAGAR